jgi:hypothetical protein
MTGKTPRISRRQFVVVEIVSIGKPASLCYRIDQRFRLNVAGHANDARGRTGVWLILGVLVVPGTLLSGQNKNSQSLHSDGRCFRVRKVAVMDPLDRYVTGLERANFKIYEDHVEQPYISARICAGQCRASFRRKQQHGV